MSFKVVGVLFCVVNLHFRRLEAEGGIKAYIKERRHNSLSPIQVFQRQSKCCISETISNAIEQLQLLTFCFVLFPFEVMRRTGKLDLTRDREKKFGSTNPAFCDVELDLTKSSIPT